MGSPDVPRLLPNRPRENFAHDPSWVAPGQYGMMTYMHEGKQYIVVQIGSIQTDFSGCAGGAGVAVIRSSQADPIERGGTHIMSPPISLASPVSSTMCMPVFARSTR